MTTHSFQRMEEPFEEIRITDLDVDADLLVVVF